MKLLRNMTGILLILMAIAFGLTLPRLVYAAQFEADQTAVREENLPPAQLDYETDWAVIDRIQELNRLQSVLRLGNGRYQGADNVQSSCIALLDTLFPSADGLQSRLDKSSCVPFLANMENGSMIVWFVQLSFDEMNDNLFANLAVDDTTGKILSFQLSGELFNRAVYTSEPKMIELAVKRAEEGELSEEEQTALDWSEAPLLEYIWDTPFYQTMLSQLQAQYPYQTVLLEAYETHYEGNGCSMWLVLTNDPSVEEKDPVFDTPSEAIACTVDLYDGWFYLNPTEFFGLCLEVQAQVDTPAY